MIQVMDLLQGGQANGLATWALVAAFVALVAALCVLLLLRKSTGNARYILGILVGIVGLYNLTFPVIMLIDGDSLSQYVVSNVFVGAALISLSAGAIFHKHNTLFSLISLLLLGPGIFLMIGSWVGSVIPAGYLLIVSLAWVLVWVSLIALLINGYMKRPKTAQDP
jgi:hypothetical protein